MAAAAGFMATAASAVDSKACKDEALMYCMGAVGADVTVECEEGQTPVDACEDGDVGRCTWDSGATTEVQWRLYAGSPLLGEAEGSCAEAGGSWSVP
jgi:hypothetical protein